MQHFTSILYISCFDGRPFDHTSVMQCMFLKVCETGNMITATNIRGYQRLMWYPRNHQIKEAFTILVCATRRCKKRQRCLLPLIAGLVMQIYVKERDDAEQKALPNWLHYSDGDVYAFAEYICEGENLCEKYIDKFTSDCFFPTHNRTGWLFLLTTPNTKTLHSRARVVKFVQNTVAFIWAVASTWNISSVFSTPVHWMTLFDKIILLKCNIFIEKKQAVVYYVSRLYSGWP